MRKIISLLGFILLLGNFSMAQVGQGGIKGKVIDAGTGEPLPFVNVIVERNGTQVVGGSSDFDGQYFIKPIPPGTYDIKATFTGYKPVQINGIVVKAEGVQFLDVKMSTTSIDITEFEVVEYTVPLIDAGNTTAGGTVGKEDILRMPGRDASSIAETVGGVISQDNGTGNLNIRGARSGDNYYFIDGMKVRGSNNVPQQAIEQVSIITGGVPSQYGDITGGVISITTKGPSREYYGGIEYTSSGYKFGDQVYGLDKFGYNLLEGSISGPLLMKKDAEGNKTEPLLGFFLSGNWTNQVDQRPSIIGTWKVKDDVLDELVDNPLRYATTGIGTFQNGEFVRLDQMEKTPTRMNAGSNAVNLSGKIDVNVGRNANLTFGGQFNYNNRSLINNAGGSALNSMYSYSLMNYDNHPQQIASTWRAFVRFTQRFGNAQSGDESASLIKNAYYSIQAEYTEDRNTTWDRNHQDDFFRYGYIGKFRRFIDRDYTFGQDSVSGIFGLVQTTFVDTLIGFYPDENINPAGAKFTSNYYALYGWDVNQNTDPNGTPVYDSELAGDNIRNFVNIQTARGMINGDPHRDIYNMWRNPAFVYNGYDFNDRSQFRITASGSADIKNHAISVGFEYEQWTDRRYFVAPRRLWELGRLYTNNHITNLDFSNPIFTGVFVNNFEVINYERLNASPGEYQGGDAQFFFDYNLRNSLGLDPDGVDFIDFDNLDPSQLSIDMFSADELFAQGNPIVQYYGYDHKGNRTRGNPSFDDFFTETDEFGNLTRPIDAFRPIYVSGYIQDNFTFDDLVFRVGVRVDRFDANQKVLDDPYVLFPTVRAGEEEALALVDGNHPGNIGDDYVVYVDDLRNPNTIVGYRSGTNWFNAEGAEISNPRILETAEGIAPLLVDKTRITSQQISSNSFRDYTPQINVMPRIAFSFPISDEALFFAHYDVLTQRPQAGVLRLDPTDYLFLESNSNFLNNPNLRPSQTIDYAIGFQQKLTNSSSLKIEAFYREMRDQVQVVNITSAFPREYRTFSNIDFGTVKGLTLSYDLRKTGNIWMRAAYTLQFAEGTGSDATTAQSLIVAGRDNLLTTNPLNFDQRHVIVTTFDYRYGSGKNYNGPVVNDKQIFANTGANFVINSSSGVPYSGQKNVVSEGLFQQQNRLLDGTINGARLPWQFRIDTRIDRDMVLDVLPGEKKLNVNVYLQVLNLLNNLNVTSVYRATGNPDDDGYLSAPQFQNEIITQTNEQSFRELYMARLSNPGQFNLPRRTRLGILITF